MVRRAMRPSHRSSFRSLGVCCSLALLLAACSPANPPQPASPTAPPTAANTPPRPTTTTPAPAAGSQTETASGYDKPPAAILDVMRAPSPPSPHVSPTGNKILLVSTVEYPP